MFKKSMIKKTGQWWKARLGFYIMIFGGLLMSVGEYLPWFVEHDAAQFMQVSGMLIGLLGMIFLFIAIRCPYCKARWIWIFASKRKVVQRWGGGLFAHETCPECDNTGVRKKSLYVDET